MGQKMGICESSQKSALKNDHSNDEARNNEINKNIEIEKRKKANVIKLLLLVNLGAGESGKSTVLKQMKIIHDNGFTNEDILNKKTMIYANLIQSMYYILNGMHTLRIPLSSNHCQEHSRLIYAIMAKNMEAEPLKENVYIALKELLADKGVQMAMEKRVDYYLPDCAPYFLENIDRLYDSNYIPTTKDILYLRVATVGVIEVTFIVKDKTLRVFDVGGQRSQRKKWIHCFDDVRALIFVTAMSEFDQVLLEDGTTNRLQESLQLFRQVCNNKYFVETSIILFLNKKDLFFEKLQTERTLRIAFPEYSGSNTYEESAKYIEKKFFIANEVPSKSIYCHHTCATDTKQVEFVLESVYDSILSAKLKGCGLY